jgi:hypothetical protein
MTSLRDLLSSNSPDIRAIDAYLDGLDHPTRLAEVRSLGGGHQKRLFDAAKGHKAIGLDFYVKPSLPPMREVVHHGKNSLPAFTEFAKVFIRPDDPAAAKTELWGYNRNPAFIETFVGPGYYVAHAHDVAGEMLVNYTRLPPRKPDGWPEIIPNSSRFSRFVYYNMKDVLRGVSSHVSIGRAIRDGKEMDAWFVLCRED